MVALIRSGLGQIKDAISISERPASVEDHAVPGHWEGDLIGGSKNSCIATLVGRHSRYRCGAAPQSGRLCREPIDGASGSIHRHSVPPRVLLKPTQKPSLYLPTFLRRYLADVDVYFCDPHSPWQRGSNENTNRLLRQYLPRGTDLSVHSQAKLSAIARQLNERPRKTFQYQTPAEKFAECVAAIG